MVFISVLDIVTRQNAHPAEPQYNRPSEPPPKHYSREEPMNRLLIGLAIVIAAASFCAAADDAQDTAATEFKMRPIGHVQKTEDKTLIVLNKEYEPPSPNTIKWSRHSALIRRTHASANGFMFGERGAISRNSMPSVSRMSQNCLVNFVSRSRIVGRYRGLHGERAFVP
jgi:hypothetical protein